MVYNELIAEMIAKLPSEDKIELLEALQKHLGMEEVKKLGKHCPLCGGDLIIDRTIDNRTWIAHCEKCGCGGLCGDRDDDEDLPTPESLAYGEEMRLEAESEDEEDDDYDEEEDEEDYVENHYPYHHLKDRRCHCEDKHECRCHDDKHHCFDFTDEDICCIKAESWAEAVDEIARRLKRMGKH